MIHTEFVFIKLVTMLLGSVVAYAAYRGYTRYHNRPLLYVAIGFAFISVGVGLEGMLFEFTRLSLYQASLVHTAFLAVGIGWILYSIYGRSTTRSETRSGRGRAW